MLEEPFADYSLQDAALFLRLAYHPEEKVASMDAMQKSLPGVLRLAHKLDAQPVFQTVRGYMTGTALAAYFAMQRSKGFAMQLLSTRLTCAPLFPAASYAEHAHTITTPAVLDWAKAADSCQQDELRLCCLVETARRLARVPTSLAGAFADANRVVDALDKGMLAQLLGLMASAGGKKLCSRLAAPGAAAAALLEVGNHGSFDCVAARFSEASAEVGRSVESPWLAAAGREWKLQVCPGGATADASGHLSGEQAGRTFLAACGTAPYACRMLGSGQS